LKRPEDKIVFFTGGNSGTGKASARDFRRESDGIINQ